MILSTMKHGTAASHHLFYEKKRFLICPIWAVYPFSRIATQQHHGSRGHPRLLTGELQNESLTVRGHDAELVLGDRVVEPEV